MLLVLCSSGRHSVSIDPTAVRQWSLCSIEKRVGAPLTHNIHLFPLLTPPDPLTGSCQAPISERCVFSLLYNFMANSSAKVIKEKQPMFYVLPLFNWNKLRSINCCSWGKCLFLPILLFLLMESFKLCRRPSPLSFNVSCLCHFSSFSSDCLSCLLCFLCARCDVPAQINRNKMKEKHGLMYMKVTSFIL